MANIVKNGIIYGVIAPVTLVDQLDGTFAPAAPIGTTSPLASADGVAAATVLTDAPLLFNGTTLDRARGNSETAALVTLAASGVSGNSADQTNYNARGLNLAINISALGGTAPTITVTIQGKDPVSGQYYTILVSAVLAAVAFTVLQAYPGLVASANLIVNAALPRTWRVLYVIAGTTPTVTATIAASLIV